MNKITLKAWQERDGCQLSLAPTNSGRPFTYRMVNQFCDGVRQMCRAQREVLAVQRIALRLRRDWHSLPSNFKKDFYSQRAVDRATERLVESVVYSEDDLYLD